MQTFRIILGLAAASLLGATLSPATALAQAAANGNRANGFDYQPTRGEIRDRVQAAHLPPPRTDSGRALENIDRDLLRKEGVSTRGVPNVTQPQPNVTSPE